MCRLLALRCHDPIPVCRFLIGGDNSFAVQSLEHPDGWGLAYYVDRIPHVVKSILPAISDQQFERISLSVESATLLAHVRRATTGAISARNCHPFQFGSWVFAHNGFIRNFPAIKKDLRARISPRLKKFVIGETDSEMFFFLFLTRLSELTPDLFASDVPEAAMARALSRSMDEVREIADVGPEVGAHSADQSWLSVLVTNGATMIGTRSGRSFAFKRTETRDGRELIIFSSEVIGGFSAPDDGSWVDLKEGEYVFVDSSLSLRHAAL